MVASRLFFIRAMVGMICLQLLGCGPGPVSIDSLMIEIPIPKSKPTQINHSDQALLGTVWRVSSKYHNSLAVWFSKENEQVLTHWVNKQGLVDMGGLLSRSERQQFNRIDEKMRSSEQAAKLNLNTEAEYALKYSRLPTVPFDIIPVGDNLLFQSRYGKLTFIQYFQLDPGGRRARFYPGINPEAWMSIAGEIPFWDRLQSALGLGGFQIHPNRAMLAGFRGMDLPRPHVSFTGGGSSVQRLVERHGASLFDAAKWEAEWRQDKELADIDNHVFTFERTSLAVPASDTDIDRISTIIRLLNNES